MRLFGVQHRWRSMARHSMLALLGLSQFYVFALVGGSIVMDDLYTTIQPSTGIYDDFDHGDDTICSVWGTGHLLTFDHASMDLPLSSCSLSLVSITGSPSLSVSFQRRALDRMSVENVVVTMEGISLSLTREGQSISGQRVQLPYKDHSIQIEMVGSYIKCSSIMGFSLLWDQNNAITVKLDPKFHTKTTGLCGDFNGIADDFYFNGDLRSESDYTLMNKLNSLELCSQEPQQTNSYLSREYCLNKTQHIEHLLQDELLSCLSVMDHQLKFLLINILLSDICRLDCNGTAGLYPCDGCATIAEFSRRCTQANGSPGMWRSPEFCGVTCPRGQVHRECGSVCKDTCSNPSASVNCPSTCVDGCFCPEGMVWDDVSGSGCIPQSNCGCNQLGHSYASGESLITGCKNCTCEQGQWNCDSRPCYGTCKILGGSYFSTFDSKTYRFHGDCFYTLTTDCTGNKFSVLGELTKCEGRDSKTCLNSVILYIDGIRTVVFKASGDVLVHENKVPLPFVSASVTVVQESSFYLRAETNFGLRLRVQLKPLMQLYITAATAYHNKTCGLCGNFNEVTGDDFTHSGIVDATAATFCNVWKAQATCPDREEVTMDPCSVYITNNEYAKTHCGLLMDNDGPFSTCHSVVSADEYYMRCKYDTCSCSYPEPCLCAALSAYAYACAANGVVLVGWRSDICSLDAENCPISHEFSYAAPECGSASCRASREVCRGVRPPPFELPSPSPVEGCVCGAGLYDDEHGVCVLKSDCPCYSEMSGDVIRAGVTVDLHDTQCLCTGGELHCFGLSPISGNTCEDPMTYHNCSDGSSEGSAACQRTCANPHSICYSPGCVSGCVCPGGLLVDHNGNCVSEEQCTCEHNGRHYNPGDTITQLCNKCTCMNARWSCTSKVCQGLCFVYGEGHHTTFDGKQYVFDGSCQYILSQDSCGNSSGSFRITTENEPCGTTGTTCSKKVHFFVGADELVLTDGTVMGSSLDLPGSPFHVRRMGIYTVVETSLGVTVIWDGHTAVSVHVDPQLKGRVCGLCGDYDGKVANDFVTRTGSVAASAPEFAAGWKESGSGCPDLSRVSDPCTINHHRESWAHKQCSVLKDGVFKQCHNMVEYLPYYTACVRDSCGCDTGGDCHCLCTSLASYAQACGSAGVCLRWRTPDLCPLGCDLYNKDEDQCEWHYRECGRGCQRSCTNRNAICTANLPPLEGCYPTCPSDRPFLNESSMTCVEQCDCVSNGTTYKANDRIPSNNSCEICSCTIDGISCTIIPGCPQTTSTITATTTESTTTTSSSTVPPTTISTTSESTTTPPPTTTPPSTTSITESTTTPPPTTAPPSTTSITESTTTPPPTTAPPSTTSITESTTTPSPTTTPPSTTSIITESTTTPPPTTTPPSTTSIITESTTTPPPTTAPPSTASLIESTTTPPPTTSPPSTTSMITESTTTPPPTTAPLSTTSVITESTPPPTTTPPFTTSITTESTTTPPTTTAPPSSTSITTESTTIECMWASWHSIDYPNDNTPSNDNETYAHYQEKTGHAICEIGVPTRIDCRAIGYEEANLSDTGTGITCDVNEGLLCLDELQDPYSGGCKNYEIRVCCLPTTTPPTTTPPSTTSITTESITTPPPTTAPPSTTSITESTTTPPPTTAPPSTTSITESTTTPPPTTAPPSTTSITESTTTPPPTTAPPSTTSIITESTTTPQPTTTPPSITSITESTTTPPPTTAPPSTTSIITESTTTPPPTTTPPSTTSIITESTTTPPPTTAPPSTTSITTESTTTPPTTTAPPSSTSITTESTTIGCMWASWGSIDYPNDNTPSNDNETYAHYQEKTGHAICGTGVPMLIDCRAIGYEEANLSDTGTGITCDVNEGLLCLEELQDPYSGGCKNYEIRVCCRPTTPSPTTAPSSTTSTTESTTAPPPTTTPPSTNSIIESTTTPPPTTTPPSTTITESTTIPPPTTAPPSTTSITESTTPPPTTAPPSTTSITESTTTPPPTTAPPSTTSITKSTTTPPPTTAPPSTTSITTESTTTPPPTTAPPSTTSITTKSTTTPPPTTAPPSTTSITESTTTPPPTTTPPSNTSITTESRTTPPRTTAPPSTTSITESTTTPPPTTGPPSTTSITTESTTTPPPTTTPPSTNSIIESTTPPPTTAPPSTAPPSTTSITESTTTPPPTTAPPSTTSITESTTTPPPTTTPLSTTSITESTTTPPPTTAPPSTTSITESTTTLPPTTTPPSTNSIIESTTTPPPTTTPPSTTSINELTTTPPPTTAPPSTTSITESTTTPPPTTAPPSTTSITTESTTTPPPTTRPPSTTSITTESTTTPPPTTAPPSTASITTESPIPCVWSEWFNSDIPNLKNEGDDETFAHIRESGTDICPMSYPVDIACQVVGSPDLTFPNFVQNVTCDVSTGLLCLNKDNAPLCKDYHIRVCCNPITTTPLTVSSTTIQSTESPSTTVTFQPSSKSSATTSITYKPTTVTTTVTLPTTTVTSVSTKTPTKSSSTTPSKSTINTSPQTPTCPPCKTPVKPVCENKALPQLVKKGCCEEYECPCFCKGWGDPHFLTFGGNKYDFQGVCQYVLVQQINGSGIDWNFHFKVLIDTYDCGAKDGVSCPQNLIISYEQYEIRLERTNNTTNVKVLLNGIITQTPYIIPGDFSIDYTQITLTVYFEKINSRITFDGQLFVIVLSHAIFGNKTEGQCGKCSNVPSNDCRLPSGVPVSCAAMAGAWNTTTCRNPAPPTKTPITTTPCPSQPCDILKSSLFAQCNKILSPDIYYDSCVFDKCAQKTSNAACASIKAYSKECEKFGFCIPWRENTNGICNITCPEGRVYHQCSTTFDKSCNLKDIPDINISNRTYEGCFCPEGEFLFTSTDPSMKESSCVSDCGCAGSNGERKKLNEVWDSDCNVCECNAGTRSVVCKPRACTALGYNNCTEPGWAIRNPSDACCPECMRVCLYNGIRYPVSAQVPSMDCSTCECTNEIDDATKFNKITCEKIICNQTCQTGYEYVDQQGACCECRKTNCTFNMSGRVILLQPGETVQDPQNNCTTLHCDSSIGGPIERIQTGWCQYKNPEDCPPGYEFIHREGECCGVCDKTKCVFNMSGAVTMLQPGKTVQDPRNNCMTLHCESTIGGPIERTQTVQCQYNNPEDCQPGYEFIRREGECCGVCEKTKCVFNMSGDVTMLEPGKTVQDPQNNCTTLHCESTIREPIERTQTVQCQYNNPEDCQPAYEFIHREGECCGDCVKTKCVFNMSGTVDVLEPGKVVQDPQNNCTTLHCETTTGEPIERTQSVQCQYNNPEDCQPGYEFIHREGECCGVCEKRRCVFNMSGTVTVLEPGKTVQDPRNNCTTLYCDASIRGPIERTQSDRCQYKNPEDCQLGYEFIHREGVCCGVCEKTKCVFNMSGAVTMLEPGEIVQDPQNNCTTLRCESTTGEPIERTQTVQCQYNNPEDCQLGYEYIHREGECCGECVKTRCVFNMSGIVTVLKPGETVQDPQNNCTTHHCKPTTGEPIEKTQTIQCSPNFNPDNCLPGTIKLDEAKCCKTCYPPPGNCRLFNSSKYIFYDACSSVEPVEVVSCEGSCPTYSMYSEQGNSVNHTCKCCRDMKTRPRSTSFLCSNGTRFDATYTFIEECGCKEFACDRSVRSIADDLGLDYPHRNHLVRKRALRAQANP
ncbi:uncharacterized protein LOC144737071 isoform X2 [Lampetra planeri]